MSENQGRDRIKQYLPDDNEIDKALEDALRREEASPDAPTHGPAFQAVHENTLVTGKVLAVTQDQVVLDISYKSEGTIATQEFGENPPAVGDEIEALVMALENQDGQVALSVVEAGRKKLWNMLQAGTVSQEIVQGEVREAVKGGLIVDVGVRAFMPAKESDIRFVEDLETFVGQRVDVRVIEVDRERQRVVVSRRAILKEERAKQKAKLFETLEVGQVFDGTVINVLEFGAFVDIGGAEGLLHRGDMAWGRVENPTDIVKPDDKVKVTVLSFDRSSGKIGLGLKQMGPSPWDDAEQRFGVGRRAKGRVVEILDFGAIVEIETGVQGLVHISEMSWGRHVRNPNEVVKLGDEVEVEVIGFESDKKKISLSMKRVEENPWASLESRYPFATIVDGTVSRLADFGAFIMLGDGVEGLVHVSELSWTKRYDHPGQMLKEGDAVKAIVLGADQERQRLSLSIRKLEPDPWWDVEQNYPAGTQVPGEITRLADFGAFCKIAEGLEGLIHISRLGQGHVSRPSDVVKPGDKVNVEVLEADEEKRRMSLAMVEREEEDGED